jgi:hypothetical protein
MYSVYFKKDLAKRFHPSKFDIQYSIFCGSLFRPAAKAAGLVIEKPCHFGVVSYKVSAFLILSLKPDT